MGIRQKILHDFYHNTWVKTFCADFGLIKDQALEILSSALKSGNYNKKSIMDEVMVMVQRTQPPEYHFHYQTIYQFINYRVNHYLKHAKKPEEVGSETTDAAMLVQLLKVFEQLQVSNQ